jgi:hypothetical protein
MVEPVVWMSLSVFMGFVFWPPQGSLTSFNQADDDARCN